MSTTENNKIIAEFMGYVVGEQYTHIKGNSRSNDELKFHSDWNWLMEVVEKIENTKTDNIIFDVFITKNKTHIHYSKNNEWFSNIFLHDGKTKIENTYNACIEFIKWYNEQKKITWNSLKY